MPDFKDVMRTEKEAEDALQRTYGASTNRHSTPQAVGYGLIAVGRCILALGVRIDHALDSRNRRES